MFNIVKFGALALMAGVPAVLGSNLNVVNHCSFNIFCGGAKNDGSSSPVVIVKGNGGTYQSPLPANNDNVGSVLKCAKNPDLSQPFQMELALQYGRSWFDLSALNGDPFIEFHRHAEIAGQCVLDCPAGSTMCEWPVQPDCASEEDAWLTLC
ncbi:hypothetical protein F4804DRAFT_142396 [Jackrogersella minutella]|nr:hypothetical protein F4804DRAFT_142396 [Jackrogersella minutella]